MATKKDPPRRKRRTREHVIAEMSANHVERHVLACGFAVEQTRHDYGIDMILFFYDAAGEVMDGQVLLQLKATDHLLWRRNRTSVAFQIDRRDLNSWLKTPQPVIFVVYDAPADRAYWLYVQAHFAGRKGFKLAEAGDTITVHLPAGNVIGADAIRRFQTYGEDVARQWRGIIHYHE